MFTQQMRTACPLFLHCRKWVSTRSCLLSPTSCASLMPCTLVKVLASDHGNIQSETRQWAVTDLWCARRETQVITFHNSGTNVSQGNASHSHSAFITTSRSSENSHDWLHLGCSDHWVCSNKDIQRGSWLFFLFQKKFYMTQQNPSTNRNWIFSAYALVSAWKRS